MGVTGGEETIVTDGLEFVIDAGNTLSYISGSTDTRDIMENNSLTVSSTPLYSTDGGGCWRFDGTDDKITLGTNLNNSIYTVCIGYRYDENDGSFGYFYSYYQSAGLAVSEGGSDSGIDNGDIYYWAGSATKLADAGTYPSLLTDWNWVTFILDAGSGTGKLYLNDQKVYDGAIGGSPSSIIDKIGTITTYNHWFEGKIANFLYYNRELTETEILQNYNATKERFGL